MKVLKTHKAMYITCCLELSLPLELQHVLWLLTGTVEVAKI